MGAFQLVLYGTKSKLSLLQRAVTAGYCDAGGTLTEKALNVIDVDRLVAKQGSNGGSEEHKELMRKTIRLIQSKGNYAFVPTAQDSFDVGELEAAGSRWATRVNAYEIQTNALAGELEKCSVRSARLAKSLASLTVVTNAIEVKERVEKGSDIRCIVL